MLGDAPCIIGFNHSHSSPSLFRISYSQDSLATVYSNVISDQSDETPCHDLSVTTVYVALKLRSLNFTHPVYVASRFQFQFILLSLRGYIE